MAALVLAVLGVAAWLALRAREGAEPGAGSVPAARTGPGTPPPPATATLQGGGRSDGEAEGPASSEAATGAEDEGGEAPTPEVGALRVRLTGPEGEAVAGLVSLRDSAGRKAEREVPAEGVTTFEGLTPGVHEVHVSVPGLLQESDERVEVAAGEPTECEVRLLPGASLEGRVVASRDGRPIVDAEVDVRGGGHFQEDASLGGRVSYGLVRTDADGRFRTPSLPFDFIVTMSVVAPGFARLERGLRLQPVEGERPSLDLRLEPGGRLRGRVRGSDGTAAADVRVQVGVASEPLDQPDPEFPSDTGGTVTVTTDAEGRFLVEGLALGVEYAAIPRVKGRAASERVAGILVSEPRPEAFVDVVLARPAAFVLLVLDAAGKALPVVASVTFGPHHEESWDLDADGTVTFEALAPGDCAVRVTAPGFVTANENVVLRAGARVERTLRLERENELSGTVVDDLDVPVGYAFVDVQTSGESPRSIGGSFTDEAGRFRVKGLPAGLVVVRAQVEDSKSARLANVAVPGPELRLVVGRKSRVSARFTIPEGSKAPDSLQAWNLDPDGSGFGGNGREWEGGRVTWDGPAGKRRLRVIAAGFAPWERVVETRPGETVDLGDVALDVGAVLLGRVLEGTSDRGLGNVVLETDVLGGPSVQTDREGRFRLPNVSRKSILLTALAHDYVSSALRVDASAPPPEIVLRLFRGGRLVATLKDAAGSPVRGVVAYVHPPGPDDPDRWRSTEASEEPDERGVVRATLAEGPYVLEVWREKVLVATSDVVLKEGKETAVEVVVPGG